MRYVVDSAKSEVVVRARSTIHNTTTTWRHLSGTVEATLATLQRDTSATIEVDMQRFDAGDWLRNRKLKKDLNVARHSRAVFSLSELRDVETESEELFRATAHGTVHWHGRTVPVLISGRGRIGDDTIEATGRFELNVREFGIAPPKFLMFKVEDEVVVEVKLCAVRE